MESSSSIPNGVVVFENDSIVHVGPDFDGTFDREIDARGKLVSPGFIDTHIHSGHRAAHRLIYDSGRPRILRSTVLRNTARLLPPVRAR